MNKIKSLNQMARTSKRGIHKKWVYKSEEDFHAAMNSLEKIRYCIEDLNVEIGNLYDKNNKKSLDMKSLCWIITITAWIFDAYQKLRESLRPEINNEYLPINEVKDSCYITYLFAIRSFVVAHPLRTDRHNKYNLDGRWTCVDYRPTTDICYTIQRANPEYSHIVLRPDGLHQTAQYDDTNVDILLYCYCHEYKYCKYVGIEIRDIFASAEFLVNEIYQLDTFLKRKKRKDYYNQQR